MFAALHGQRDVGEPHGRGEREGHGEPDEPARQESPDALLWFGRHAALPVRLVYENCPEVACKAGSAFVFTSDRCL